MLPRAVATAYFCGLECVTYLRRVDLGILTSLSAVFKRISPFLTATTADTMPSSFHFLRHDVECGI
jgi:hypothetical protein